MSMRPEGLRTMGVAKRGARAGATRARSGPAASATITLRSVRGGERRRGMLSIAKPVIPSAHPLDPLSAAEVERAAEIVRTERGLGSRTRFIFTMLHEPEKKVVLAHRPGDAVERAAFVVLVDCAAGKTYEATVSLTQGRVVGWEHVPGVQPAIVLDEVLACEAAVREDPRWQEAMRKRGVTDLSLTMVDPWSAGNFGLPGEEGRRLVRALTWVRRHAADNGYARPVANLLAVVDLERDEGAPGRGRRRRPIAAGGRQLHGRVGRGALGTQADRDPPARGPELRASRPRARLAEVADADRVHAPRRPGDPYRDLRRRGTGAPGPLSRLRGRHGGALRRSAADLFPPQCVRRGGVRDRLARQCARERL